MRNLFNARQDSCLLLASFGLHAPTRSVRTHRLFYEPRPRVDTIKRGLFLRVPNEASLFLQNVPDADFFADSPGTFKRHVLQYISSF